jgi:DNA recombination protein RmuC
MELVTALVSGVVLGVVLGVVVAVPVAIAFARRQAVAAGTEELEWELHGLAEEQRRFGEELLQRLQESSRAHLDHERVRASTELDGKKALIDQQLGLMHTELGKVGELVRGLDADRRTAFGQLANELQRQHEGLNQLTENTRQLREAFASQKVRGQWGERIADDVLRLSGFLEGVNYRRQHTLAASGGRPDYTFLMPNDLVLHMDVKFPLDNYLRFLDADTDLDRRRYRDQFLKDVRERVRELTSRGYLDASTETVDCLLLFIPNEQVYAFVHEHDRNILDDALRHKIVLCSPLTLYAVLAVVRQAVDNFRLEKTSDEILTLLAEFSQQWEKYVIQLDKVQQRFDAVGKEYTALMTTRHRALQRQLDKVEALRHHEPALADAPHPPFALEGGSGTGR